MKYFIGGKEAPVCPSGLYGPIRLPHPRQLPDFEDANDAERWNPYTQPNPESSAAYNCTGNYRLIKWQN